MRAAAILLLAAASVWGALDAIAKRIVAGDGRGALAALDAIPAADRDAEWHLLASKSWDALNNPVRSVAEAQSAIELAPRSEAARLQLAQIFLSHNTPEAAYEILSAALPLFPDSAVLRLGLGLALNSMRRYDEAVPNLKACLRLQSSLAPAFDALGAAYLNQGSYEALEYEAAEYTQKHPNDFRGPYYEAAAREELSLSEPRTMATPRPVRFDPKETEALVRRSTALNPKFAAAQALLGRVLLDQDRLEEAAAALREAIRLRPDYTPAHLYLSTALRRLGKNDEARQEAGEVSRLNADQNRPAPHLLYHRGNERGGNRPPDSAESNQK